ncbi:phosphoribosylanthranilate isomerase [Sporobacter termitidis DSM 10068]|uniref:N-(5'-phosphoribosyl)anthranilate isomerase n=1 Tax=Sporobacter termitidis DSM 10068 TaxID=1123282 RepID=A0A1M5ZB73_9FIRM|nr:phosphoribosylanthranilate isomerase [Sporobacter termitidis]SHI21470.1 phosphoribosylanthranilate isomerase [Sporobacter termitidis DSM 10068]
MTKIKICGLTRPQDIDAVNEARPDYIGFVFAESRRKVTPEQAAGLKRRLDGRIRAVGVFVNAGPDEIARVVRDGTIDLVQLHGDEDAAYIEDLKRRVGIPVIKAVRVQSPGQVLAAQALPCDYLLLDTYQKDAYGGTGKTFDHGLIPPLQKPFFLAGGLNAGNIKEAAALGPWCLDVSGGAETDGVKDAAKIIEIVRIVKTGEHRSPSVVNN